MKNIKLPMPLLCGLFLFTILSHATGHALGSATESEAITVKDSKFEYSIRTDTHSDEKICDFKLDAILARPLLKSDAPKVRWQAYEHTDKIINSTIRNDKIIVSLGSKNANPECANFFRIRKIIPIDKVFDFSLFKKNKYIVLVENSTALFFFSEGFKTLNQVYNLFDISDASVIDLLLVRGGFFAALVNRQNDATGNLCLELWDPETSIRIRKLCRNIHLTNNQKSTLEFRNGRISVNAYEELGFEFDEK